MCSIIGTFNMVESALVSMCKKMAIRGRDGYGYFVTDSMKSATNKELTNIEDIENISEVAVPKVFLANSRAVPTTEYETGAGFDIKNQQPFESDKYVVVHNGIISNDKELKEEYNINPISKVDSAILPHLFERVGVIEGLKKLKGSFAIICYDKENRILYAAKNFMPLRYALQEDRFVIASLDEISTCYETQEMEPYTCYKIMLRDSDKYVTEAISLYPKKRNKKVLVVCSGGIDSVTTAYLYKHLGYEVTLLHFLYGQSAQEAEEFAVKSIGGLLGAKVIIYDARKTFEPFKDASRLLKENELDKDSQMLDAESTLSYVPNRNMIFASIGAGIAEMLKCDTLAQGLQQMDSIYPDNNPTYLNALDQTLKYSLNWNTNIGFRAPLMHLIKHEIVALGKKLGIDYDKTVPCYHPKIVDNKIVRCHKCGCCSFADNAYKMCKEKDFIGDKETFITKYVQSYT